MNKFIPIAEPSITEKEIEYVTDAVKSGWVSSLGEYLSKFEKKFAEYTGVKYALSITNGTAALHLALLSLGIKRGDEVIVPDLTFVATANAVTYAGAKPVFADIALDIWCIDPEDIKRKVTSKTKGVIPVHLYGHPADMDTINQIASERGLYIIEDAAEAHGAEYKGKKVGSFADCGIFSFYGNKIITTGEGGMITTNNKRVYEKAKFLRDHAMSRDKKYWHTKIGYNYRMTNLQAALGLAQLERIDKLIEKKRQIHSWYKGFLSDVEVKLNPEDERAKNVYWMVCLILNSNFAISKDELMIKLKEKNIDTRPFFYPISKMPMYNDGKINPVAYEISKKGLILPSGTNLKKNEVKWITENIKKILKK